jgi:DNA-directed RNA polymerase specialized sigma24 family protein
LLSGGTPREILCRIVQGDPLEMRDRVARRLRAGAYLVDADRVQLRALARCARFAQRYTGRPDLATWLDEIVDAAIEDLLREDAGADGDAEASEAAPDTAFVALARPLGLEPSAMRRACAAFNRLPVPDRRAFFDLVIDGGSLDELARRSGENASELARRARRALDVLLQAPSAAPASREKESAREKESHRRASPAPEPTTPKPSRPDSKERT